MADHYFGVLCALAASVLWSITVTLVKPISLRISPFLINPIKNSIGFFLFFILFIIVDIPLWYDHLYNYEYMIILLSGSLGMVLGDTIFIYALSRIGANRVISTCGGIRAICTLDLTIDLNCVKFLAVLNSACRLWQVAATDIGTSGPLFWMRRGPC